MKILGPASLDDVKAAFAANGHNYPPGGTLRTNLVMVIDRSGSMDTVQHEASKAVNAFIAEQQAVEGKCRFTLVQFDSTSIDVIYDNVKLASVSSPYELLARGGTPLYDAVGQTIVRVEQQNIQRLIDQKKPFDKTIFVILTDGLENASSEYHQLGILAMVTAKTEQGWDFVYLGAAKSMAERAAHVGQSTGYGTRPGSTVTFDNSNYAGAVAATASAVTRSRTTGQSVEYTEQEREQAEAPDA